MISYMVSLSDMNRGNMYQFQYRDICIHMPLEKVRNKEEEDQPLSPDTVRDLKLARTQVAKGQCISLDEVLRRRGIE